MDAAIRMKGPCKLHLVQLYIWTIGQHRSTDVPVLFLSKLTCPHTREAAVQVNQELCSLSETVIALQAVCPHMQYILKTDRSVSCVYLTLPAALKVPCMKDSVLSQSFCYFQMMSHAYCMKAYLSLWQCLHSASAPPLHM